MPRILVVEDEPGIAMAIEEDLRTEGHEVELMTDGKAALRRALSEPFDLIVLDVMLPGKDGYQVCRELRAKGLHTPILILTARTQEIEKVMGLNLGADDYVSKPYGTLELCARVNALLRRSAPNESQPIRFGNIELDVTGFRLLRGGKTVAITALEFKILVAMVRARGRVLTREQLIESIWDGRLGVTDRVIDTHIANLRKKIEPDPLNPTYLTSVRGVGYRFDG